MIKQQQYRRNIQLQYRKNPHQLLMNRCRQRKSFHFQQVCYICMIVIDSFQLMNNNYFEIFFKEASTTLTILSSSESKTAPKSTTSFQNRNTTTKTTNTLPLVTTKNNDIDSNDNDNEPIQLLWLW
jgi:hypothetical protein